MKRKIPISIHAAAFILCLIASGASAAVKQSEISVKLAMTHDVYVDGERLRAVIDVSNSSPDSIDCLGQGSSDKLFVELFRASDQRSFDRIDDKPFTAGFALLPGEGQKLETFIGDHFLIDKCTRYLARAVLVHGGMRFESTLKSFNVVPGIPGASALQMFSNRDGLQRRFELVHIGRNQLEHIFLKARDEGTSSRRWRTTDLGPVLRLTPPKISISPKGEVTVLHRASQDKFLYSVFWSLPDELEFQTKEVMSDPEVVGAERMRELYKEAGGLEPVRKAWWKFW